MSEQAVLLQPIWKRSHVEAHGAEVNAVTSEGSCSSQRAPLGSLGKRPQAVAYGEKPVVGQKVPLVRTCARAISEGWTPCMEPHWSSV